MSPGIESRRQQIAAAEQAVEHHRAHFAVQNEARRERWQAWKVPLILGGGALLGLLLGRSRARHSSSRRDALIGGRRHDPHASAAPTVQTAKAAGKAAGVMAGLSLAARVAPMVLPLVQRYLASRRPGSAHVMNAPHSNRADWWAVADSIAPLFRR